MTKQKSPQTQSEENMTVERDDLQDAPNETGTLEAERRMYERMEGAEHGENRSARKFPSTRNMRHRTEPEIEGHEGGVSSRTTKRPAQGVTAHSSEEEGARQEKVVKDRPDAQAALNRSKPITRKRA